MANPQVENGYVRISNELMEAMSQIRISGESMQCLLVIFRETYGYNRKSKSIPNKHFETKTGIRKQHINRAIQKLKDMNLILVTNNGYRKPPIYKINKDYGSWKKTPKKVTVTNNGYKSNPKRLQQYPIMVTNSDGLKTLKDNIKTESISFLPKCFNNDPFKQTFNEFKQHRKSLKSKMTERAERMLIRKLSELSNDNPNIAVEIMEQSILNGWKGVFPLKNNQKQREPEKIQW